MKLLAFFKALGTALKAIGKYLWSWVVFGFSYLWPFAKKEAAAVAAAAPGVEGGFKSVVAALFSLKTAGYIALLIMLVVSHGATFVVAHHMGRTGVLTDTAPIVQGLKRSLDSANKKAADGDKVIADLKAQLDGARTSKPASVSSKPSGPAGKKPAGKKQAAAGDLSSYLSGF